MGIPNDSNAFFALPPKLCKKTSKPIPENSKGSVISRTFNTHHDVSEIVLISK